MTMLDDFFTRALIAGLATAALTGPIGCFIIWRRMSFFGDTLSHSALLGVGLGLFFSIYQTLSVFLVALGISVCLQWLRRTSTLSADTSLGILSHGALALGLLMLSILPPSQVDISSVFFGDILASSREDVYLMIGGLIGGLIIMRAIWHPLLVATINQDIAKAEGVRLHIAETIFIAMLTMVIAFSFKIVGALLISALLVIPAATSRQITSSPEATAILASILGCICVTCGLVASLYMDLPSGPAIVVISLILFVLSFVMRMGRT